MYYFIKATRGFPIFYVAFDRKVRCYTLSQKMYFNSKFRYNVINILLLGFFSIMNIEITIS